MNKRDSLGRFIYEFEIKYCNELKAIEIFDFNAWQILKYPLYWHIINQDATIQNEQTGRGFKTYFKDYSAKFYRQLIKIRSLFSFLISFSKVYLRKVNKPNLVLFYTKSADKKMRRSDQRFFNPLTDNFILNKAVPSYVYVEIPDRGKFKKPAIVNTDIEIQNLGVLNAFLFRKTSSGKNIDSAADRLYELVSKEFGEEFHSNLISKSFISKTLNLFYSEFTFFTFFLKCIKPKLIITSEEIGFGFQGAARKLSIRTIDLQHGVIDRYHPQYIYSRELQSIKDKMIIPDYIGVFGMIHKEQLLNNGFWHENEIVLLGNSNIDGIIKKSEILDHAQYKEEFILIPTQRFVNFKEMMVLLEELSHLQKPNFKIMLKMHPMEPESNIEEYKLVALKKPNFIEIVDKDVEIYELIKSAILVVGFDSMTLLDAIGLAKPCITLSTESAPKGIHEFFWTNELERVIKRVKVTDVDGLIELINRSIDDKVFYDNWKKHSGEASERLNCGGYEKNCEAFIYSVFSAN
jgi:hypothetical protein